MRVCGGGGGGGCKGIDENNDTYSIKTILVVLTLPLRFCALINCEYFTHVHNYILFARNSCVAPTFSFDQNNEVLDSTSPTSTQNPIRPIKLSHEQNNASFIISLMCTLFLQSNLQSQAGHKYVLITKKQKEQRTKIKQKVRKCVTHLFGRTGKVSIFKERINTYTCGACPRQ